MSTVFNTKKRVEKMMHTVVAGFLFWGGGGAKFKFMYILMNQC